MDGTLSFQRNTDSETPPPFDPSKPFSTVDSKGEEQQGGIPVSDTPPPFDPSQPFEPAEEVSTEELPVVEPTPTNMVYENTKKTEIDRLHNEYVAEKTALDIKMEKQKASMLATRKERARQEEGELEPNNIVVSAITGNDYDKGSVIKKWNSLRNTGLNNNQIMQELGKLGVPQPEISKARHKIVGNATGDTTVLEDVSTALDVAQSVGAQVGMWGGEYLHALTADKDAYADVLARYSPLSMVNNVIQGRDPTERSKIAQDFYDSQRAKNDAYTEQVKQDIYRGGGSFSEFAGSHTLDAALAGWNPTSVAKNAFAGGLFGGASATKGGADTTGINTAVLLTAIGSGVIAGAFKYGPEIYNHLKVKKDLPKHLQQVWVALKHRTGLSDEELMEGFRAYGKEFTGKDPEELMSSYIAHTIANKPTGARGGTLEDLYQNTVIGDKKSAETVRKAITTRASELDKVHTKSNLGQLIARRRTANSDGVAVDWDGLLSDINNYSRTHEGAFDLKSPLIKLIARNAKLYSSNDIAMKKILDGLKFNDKTIGEEIVDAAGNIVKARMTTEMAGASGVKTIASNSGFSKLAKLAFDYSPQGALAKQIFKHIPVVQDSLVLKDFIRKQLGSGEILNPRTLEAEMRRFQAVAHMKDKDVEKLVDEVVKASQMTELTAHQEKVKSRLEELNTNIKELRIEKERALNMVNKAKVAVDEADAGLPRMQARAELEDANKAYRKVKAENDEAIIDNKELQMTLESMTPARAQGRVMKPILNKMVDKGRALNPKPLPTPSDFIQPIKTEATKSVKVEPVKSGTETVALKVETSVSNLSRLERKMIDLKNGRGGKIIGRFHQRLARREYLPQAFGGRFANGFEKAHLLAKNSGDTRSADDIISDYIIENSEVTNETINKVSKYYELNPSFVKLDDGSWGFGIPKNIRKTFGLDQKVVEVPNSVIERIRKLPMNEQPTELKIDSMTKLAKGECDGM